jgi:hypothetical protein
MADPLLASSDWPAVRAALDITLDSAQLPDATIALDIYSGRAMREVEARVTGATGLTGDDELKVTAAAVFLTAAHIAPALPAIMRARQPAPGRCSAKRWTGTGGRPTCARWLKMRLPG